MSPDPVVPQLPERVTMGLLPYLNAHALDEDYAEAADRRAAAAKPPRRRVGRGGAAVLAVFAVLAVTAAVQTSRNSGSESHERDELIEQVQQRREAVNTQRRTISALQAETGRLEDELFRNSDDSDGLLARIDLLSLRSGTAPAVGPGVAIIADDAPDAQSDRNKVLDSDLQKLVNGLWKAGAEAISINGERLTALSAIRHAGTAITVNYKSLERPYRILAIGNPDQLQARFAGTTSGQAWLDLTQEVGLVFEMDNRTSLRLPGAEVPQLRWVESAADEKTGPGQQQRKELP